MDIARAVEQAGDYLMAPLQHLAVAQRMMQPVPQQAAAHAGGAVVEQREKRRRGLAAQRLGELEVAPGRRVEAHVFAGAFGGYCGEVSERLALGLAGVFEQPAAGADRERQVLAAVTGEGAGAQLP